MTLSSNRGSTGQARAFRGLAVVAVLCGLALGLPRADAQETPATPGVGDEPAVPAPVKTATSTQPVVLGEPSAVSAVGWNGRTANVLHVEGAVRDAPLTPATKPRPQNDWFVQRLRAPVPTILNPFVNDAPDLPGIARHVLGRLLEVDPDAPPQAAPALAVSWTVSEGGRVCTYRLRKGVQFADGRPFTAADVVFSYEAAQDPAVHADHLRSSLEEIASMEATDDHTVVVRFKHVLWKARYVVGRALPILNSGWYAERIPDVAAKLGVADASAQPGKPGFATVFNQMPEICPGTGAYYLASMEAANSDTVDLVANPFSWRMQVQPERHNFTGLRWRYLLTVAHAFHAFVNGELDVWVVPHALSEGQLSRDPRVAAAGRHYVYDHIGIDCSTIAWNCRKAPFDDANVRRAMTHLTDRERILHSIEQGHGAIASCKSKRSYPTYSTDIAPHAYDSDQAEVHLIRAGWTRDTDEDGILDRKGKPFTFKLTYPDGARSLREIAERLQLKCRSVGLDMQLDPVGPEEFHRAVRSRRFDAIIGYSAWPDPWIDLYGGFHKSQDKRGGGNVSGWDHPRANELLEQMRREPDDAARTKLHHEFNRIFHEEQPHTLLIHGKVGVWLSKRMRGVSIRPTGLQSFDLWVHPEDVQHGEPLPK